MKDPGTAMKAYGSSHHLIMANLRHKLTYLILMFCIPVRLTSPMLYIHARTLHKYTSHKKTKQMMSREGLIGHCHTGLRIQLVLGA